MPAFDHKAERSTVMQLLCSSLFGNKQMMVEIKQRAARNTASNQQLRNPFSACLHVKCNTFQKFRDRIHWENLKLCGKISDLKMLVSSSSVYLERQRTQLANKFHFSRERRTDRCKRLIAPVSSFLKHNGWPDLVDKVSRRLVICSMPATKKKVTKFWISSKEEPFCYMITRQVSHNWNGQANWL